MTMQPNDANAVQARAQDLLDHSVGENLDQLMIMDMRGDGLGRALYQAARRLSHKPLSLAAAASLLASVVDSDPVLFLTGFRVPPWGVPETDGLIGSAVLASALERARGIRPVFVCETEVTGALSAALRGSGMGVSDDLATALPHVARVISYPAREAEARQVAGRMADQIAATACVAIERPGRNAAGQYHFALGRNVSDWIAPIDFLYERAAARGALTVAVGDFGNELGMGAIADTVRRETPAGSDCGCGCGEGTACLIGADVTVACSVSDWGAYAIAACLSHLGRDPAVLIDSGRYRRVLEAAVASGAIDGTSTYAIPHVDGIDDGYNVRLLEVMRSVVAYPNRSGTHGPIRLHRSAERTGGES